MTPSETQGAKFALSIWIQGFACCVAQLLKEEGQRTTFIDQMFFYGVGSISRAIKEGVDENDIEEFKKHYTL